MVKSPTMRNPKLSPGWKRLQGRRRRQKAEGEAVRWRGGANWSIGLLHLRHIPWNQPISAPWSHGDMEITCETCSPKVPVTQSQDHAWARRQREGSEISREDRLFPPVSRVKTMGGQSQFSDIQVYRCLVDPKKWSNWLNALGNQIHHYPSAAGHPCRSEALNH